MPFTRAIRTTRSRFWPTWPSNPSISSPLRSKRREAEREASTLTMSPDQLYGVCNLVGNPFRSNPTHSSDPRIDIWVGYERQQDQLMKFLARTRADQVGNTNFLMLYGGYGTGKSHALLWAQNRILKEEAGT